MGSASNLQTSFLGGEIAPAYQGRADSPKYKIGMAKCFNSLPLEQGSWTRRPGTRCAAPTRMGVLAQVIDFDFSQNAPYTMELTAGHLRFFSAYSLVHTYDQAVVSNISTASPAVVTYSGGFSNGDMVEFVIDNMLTPDDGALLRNKQFLINNQSGNTFQLFDSITGANIDGSTLNWSAGTPTLVERILDLATPYTSPMLGSIRAVQALNGTTNTVVLLHNQVPPQSITSTNPPAPTFAINASSFTDGPYLDPDSRGITLTPSGVGPGDITLTASAPVFALTDVGRHIRLFSQPNQWASGTAYTTGNLVMYQGAAYVALQNSTGVVPGTDAVNWGIASNATAWVWGVVKTFTDSTHAVVTLKTVNTATTTLPGVLVNTLGITTWRFGLFNAATGYPSCGTYHEGRLWLSGVVGNRIDGSVPNDIFNFSPTAVDGTVSDANAIAATFNSKDINSIFWMSPQQNGIVCGTQAGEWLVQASQNGDPLTPTSFQAHRVTKYGSANIEPADAPFATVFVERNNRKMFEYLADVFSGKYAGINLSLTGSHLSTSGIAEVRYQKELVPVCWARMNDGSLAGITYRRDSAMLSSEAAMAGWHSHALGTGRSIVSIAVGPSMGGNLDTLTMVTYDPTSRIYWVELMSDVFPENGTNLNAWFVDGATTPAGSLISGTNLIVYGLNYVEGQTVSAYIAGIDAGDFTVSGGQITIPLPAGYNVAAGTGALTTSLLQSVSDPNLYGPMAMPVAYVSQTLSAFSIQEYNFVPSVGIVGTSLYNPIKNQLMVFNEGSNVANGIQVFDVTSGAQVKFISNAQLFGTRGWGLSSPYCMGYDGYLYISIGAGNNASIAKVNIDQSRIIEQAGDVNAFEGLPSAMPFPATLSMVRNSGGKFIVFPGFTNNNVYVAEVTDGQTAFAGFVKAIDEVAGYGCGTYDGNNSAYILGQPNFGGSGTTSPCGIYRVDVLPAASQFSLAGWTTSAQNGGISMTKIGTVSPAQVDATWTHFINWSGICYDHQDGNLLAFASTNDSVTNKNYMLKINATTAAVMWKTPVNSIPGKDELAKAYAAFGTFYFCGGAGGNTTLYAINTSSGSTTSQNVPGLNTTSAIYDARVGAVFQGGQFGQTVGSPTLLNSTPANWTGQWSRLVATLTPSTGRATYVVPAAVGKTYTSQGQRLRPVEPVETGARNGPALGKTRRNHRSAFLFLNAAGVAIGTAFNKLRAAIFKSPGSVTTYAPDQLYSGVYSTTIEDNNSYEGQICWQVTRPHPATVLSNEGFLETEDR